jgi:hypothetical protein
VPGGPEAIDWKYVTSDSGTLKFEAPLTAGIYEVYLLCCDGYEVKAQSGFKVVGMDAHYIVSAKYDYVFGEPFEFAYNSPNYVPTDWIGIYNMGEIPGGSGIYSIIWKYLPQGEGTMTFTWPDSYSDGGPTEAPIGPGNYWAGLFCCDAYGLYAMTEFIITEDNVGVDPVQNPAGSLSMFPNPSDGRITIRLNEGGKMERIEVYSLAGQVLYREQPDGAFSERVLDLKLGKGIYFIEVTTESSTICEKLIIQ